MSVKQAPQASVRSRSSQSLLYVGAASVVIIIALLCFGRTLFFLGGVLDTLLSRPEEGGAGVVLQAADFDLVTDKLRLTEDATIQEPPVVLAPAVLIEASSSTESGTVTSTETIE